MLRIDWRVVTILIGVAALAAALASNRSADESSPGGVVVLPQANIKPGARYDVDNVTQTERPVSEAAPAEVTIEGIIDQMRTEGQDPSWSPSTEFALRRALDATPIARLSAQVNCSKTVCLISGTIPGDENPYERDAGLSALQGPEIGKIAGDANLDDRDIGVIDEDPSGGGKVRFKRFVWRR